MKRTSYIIIGMAVLGAAISVIYSLTTLHGRENVNMGVMETIGPDIHAPIERIELAVKNDNSLLSHYFEGMDIILADSIGKPRLCVDSIFARYLKTDFADGKLTLSLSFDNNKTQGIVSITHKSRPLSIYLPGHPLQSISSTFGKLRITGLDAKKLTLYSNNNLTMEYCHIDSLFLTAGGYAKTKFRDCAFDYVRLKMEDNYIKINCCDSTTLIKRLDFTARTDVKTDVFLNEANIDTFYWNQSEPAQLTVRMRHPINLEK